MGKMVSDIPILLSLMRQVFLKMFLIVNRSKLQLFGTM